MKVITIGRSSENDVVINDSHASRHHLQIISFDDGSFRLSDFGSTNGTYVNGQKISGEIVLNPTDIVRIGKTTIPWMSYFEQDEPNLPEVHEPPDEPIMLAGNNVQEYVPQDIPADRASNEQENEQPSPRKRKFLPWLLSIVATIITIGVIALFTFSNKEVSAGTTYSYTQIIQNNDVNGGITSYFVFTSPTDVAWLMGTPSNNMFPVGFGKYYPSDGEIIFSEYDDIHRNISLYYQNGRIVFQFNPKKELLRLKEPEGTGVLSYLYNNGDECPLNKEKDRFLRDDLIGTEWTVYSEEYSGKEVSFERVCEDNERNTIRFVSDHEALIDGDSHAYVYIDNMVAIKSGDNIDDENLCGAFVGGTKMNLCRDGLAVFSRSQCFTFHKI